MARRATVGLRSESVFDIYNLLLAMVLFASPWFFAHASRTAGIDQPGTKLQSNGDECN